MLRGQSAYLTSSKLPELLLDPVKTQSESALETPFQAALGTKLHFFDWLEQPIQQPDGTTKPNPQLALFGLGMIGLGRTQCMQLYYGRPAVLIRV